MPERTLEALMMYQGKQTERRIRTIKPSYLLPGRTRNGEGVKNYRPGRNSRRRLGIERRRNESERRKWRNRRSGNGVQSGDGL